MQCSEVGIEVWLLFALSAVGVVLFLVMPRSFQTWIRVRRATHPMIRGLPDAFFRDSGVWTIRALGVIPALMFLAASMGVYCYFRGLG